MGPLLEYMKSCPVIPDFAPYTGKRPNLSSDEFRSMKSLEDLRWLQAIKIIECTRNSHAPSDVSPNA